MASLSLSLSLFTRSRWWSLLCCCPTGRRHRRTPVSAVHPKHTMKLALSRHTHALSPTASSQISIPARAGREAHDPQELRKRLPSMRDYRSVVPRLLTKCCRRAALSRLTCVRELRRAYSSPHTRTYPWSSCSYSPSPLSLLPRRSFACNANEQRPGKTNQYNTR